VTEEELKALVEEHGWYLMMVRRYKTRYAYAKKREGKTVIARYIITEAKLSQLSREEVLKKLNS
jgi:hypothetical protein